MATRSTIALEFADNTVQSVYCHWDGYISNNGKILQDHYQDPFKVRDLIDGGSISSLGKDIGEQHDFDCPHKYGTTEYTEWRERYRNMTTFYARDRGEDLVISRFKDFADYLMNNIKEEFNYILRRDGQWYVSCDGSFVPLTQALLEDEVAADE